ncbi:polyketide cyclase [Intrasporangium oryzae NRRL B-24470]|uniref:Polyketide cyclase n=1 Tax=Intrasporangium oryzae NRRL B-24470 TaxID=1386089 RepID=W9G7V0_9MICO|nr:SRPBCC family protein [Intrasporangium oryzae]EWT02095.1 polyketide cyclase [Intrasporangium oryzae NRRL B-24470]
MSTTTRLCRCEPEDVFAVLADGWSYASWVVGAARIRDVSPDWPSPGATIHHSVGAWPLLLHDCTVVRSADAPTRLELEVRAWPSGQGVVTVSCERVADGTRVTMVEDATQGPASLVPKVLRDPVLDWRNTETLRRLATMAEHRARSTSGPTA